MVRIGQKSFNHATLVEHISHFHIFAIKKNMVGAHPCPQTSVEPFIFLYVPQVTAQCCAQLALSKY